MTQTLRVMLQTLKGSHMTQTLRVMLSTLLTKYRHIMSNSDKLALLGMVLAFGAAIIYTIIIVVAIKAI